MRSVLCVPGRGDRVPHAHQWARAHLAGRCGISRCGCQDAAGDREGGRDGDSSAAWPGEQPGWEQGGSTPGCCACHPPGGRFSLSKPGMAQLPSAHGTPAPLAALAGAFLGNVKTARDFLVTAVTPSWRGGGRDGRQGAARSSACSRGCLERAGGAHPAPPPNSPQHHAVPGPPPAPTLSPRLPGQIRNQATQPLPAATPVVPPPPVPKPQPGGRVPPARNHPELSVGRRSWASPEHPACPHLTSAPPSRGHPRRPTKLSHLHTSRHPSPPQGARPPQAGRSACTLGSRGCDTHTGAASTAVTSCPMPCRAGGSAEQTQTAGGVRVEPRGAAGCCAHSPPAGRRPPGAAGDPAVLRQKPRPRARRLGGPCGAIRELFIISSCGPG